jgi:outer membrane receptor protein involved in Fe transport
VIKLTVSSLAIVATVHGVPAFAQDVEDNETAIIVTGSRIPQPNLDAVSPVTVIGAEDIQAQGTTRIEDLLNSLPSIVAGQTSSLANGADGTATVDLRGLGAARTLSLINGRRIVPGTPGGGSSAADINIIPASLLSRVEVLTGGASSTYGADAVAGVVNFIIDTEFEGLRVDLNNGFYQHNNRNKLLPPLLDARANAGFTGFDYPTGSSTDGNSFDGTVALGSSFADGRGHAMAYLGYRKVNAVTQSARDYSACVVQNSGSGVPECGGSLTNAPGTALLFDTALTSGTSTVYTFAPNGGFENTVERFNFAPTNYYQRPDERYTAGVFLNYEVNDSVKPYLEFMFMDDSTVAQIAPSGNFGNTLTVNCDNPLISAQQRAVICDSDNLINGFIGTFPTAQSAGYNPNPAAPPIQFFDSQGNTYNQGFLQLLRRNVEGGPRQSNLSHTTYRGVLGSKGALGDSWTYDAYYQFGRVNYDQIYTNEQSVARLTRALNVVTDTRPGSATFNQPVCRSVIDGSDPNCKPYNVFAGAGGISPEATAYLAAQGIQTGSTTEQVANVSFTGELGDYGVVTPWASNGMSVNFGGEYRKESLELFTDNAFSTGDLTGQGGATLPISGNFRVFEMFGEAQLPVIQDSFIYDFTLSAGYRRSFYKTSADRKYNTDTFKFGAEISPIEDVRFRGTYSRAVRAPNIQELFGTPAVGLNGSSDPCATGDPTAATDYGCIAQGLAVGQGTTPNPAGQYNGLIGGNPNLLPEKGTTISGGVVIRPSVVPGLAITVDYFDIKVENAIRSFGQDAILSDCVDNATATFTPTSCGFVNRDAAGSLWLTPGGFVRDLPDNVGSQRTKGFEGSLSYRREIGDLGRASLSYVGTLLDSYVVDNGLTPVYDCAGLYGPTCSVGGSTDAGGPLPKYRHKVRIGFDMDNGIGLSAQWRHISSVDAETTSDSPSLQGSFFYNPGVRLDAINYFDLTVKAMLQDRYELRLGVNNVFDVEPPLVTSGNGNRAGSNLCPTGPCNGNTYPGTYDALGRYLFVGLTFDF